MTVLLAEDDSAIRCLFGEALRAAGYNVLEAEDGAEALTTSRVFPEEIALLLSDFNMPHLTGCDLATTILRERPAVKVLIMTGSSVEVPMQWLPHMIEKPVSISSVLARVHRELNAGANPNLDSRQQAAVA